MAFTSGTRAVGTDSRGLGFESALIQAVWEKGRVVPGVDPRFKRKGVCGAWIERSAYGKTAQLGSGWEIDHVKPVARGGSDELYNLQPLQWQNNRAKGDSEFGWAAAAVAKE
jgi:hypothetical protein